MHNFYQTIFNRLPEHIRKYGNAPPTLAASLCINTYDTTQRQIEIDTSTRPMGRVPICNISSIPSQVCKCLLEYCLSQAEHVQNMCKCCTKYPHVRQVMQCVGVLKASAHVTCYEWREMNSHLMYNTTNLSVVARPLLCRLLSKALSSY